MYTLIILSMKTKALTSGYKITFGKVMYVENWQIDICRKLQININITTIHNKSLYNYLDWLGN